MLDCDEMESELREFLLIGKGAKMPTRRVWKGGFVVNSINWAIRLELCKLLRLIKCFKSHRSAIVYREYPKKCCGVFGCSRESFVIYLHVSQIYT